MVHEEAGKIKIKKCLGMPYYRVLIFFLKRVKVIKARSTSSVTLWSDYSGRSLKVKGTLEE